MNLEDAKKAFRSQPKSEVYFAEAQFGYDKIHPQIKTLLLGARVLEVGAGSGILLSTLASEFPGLNFTGLEPMGDGFQYEDTFHKLINEFPNAHLHPTGYEAMPDTQKFDLIYLVNVFEHLPDWQDFLKFVRTILSPTGTCIVLCPNYSFPYEPHFQIPIVFTKKITHALLGKTIKKFEKTNDCAGLWKSLNFVKLSKVKHRARMLNLNVGLNKTILREMVSRLDSDPVFAKRQGVLRTPIFILKKTGLMSFLFTSKITERFIPYMHLSFSHSSPNP